MIYNDNRGGYINNVPQTFTRSHTDIGIKITPRRQKRMPPPTARHQQRQPGCNAINPVTYPGHSRLGLWKINDDWDVLLTQSYQNMDAQGVFYQMPLAPIAVVQPWASRWAAGPAGLVGVTVQPLL